MCEGNAGGSALVQNATRLCAGQREAAATTEDLRRVHSFIRLFGILIGFKQQSWRDIRVRSLYNLVGIVKSLRVGHNGNTMAEGRRSETSHAGTISVIFSRTPDRLHHVAAAGFLTLGPKADGASPSIALRTLPPYVSRPSLGGYFLDSSSGIGRGHTFLRKVGFHGEKV